MHAFAHILGLDTQSSYWYDFWSGVATQATLLVALGAVIRRHNCHVRGCWRIGHHQYDGWLLCSKHLPRDLPRAADLQPGK